MAKLVISGLIVAFVLFYVITSPNNAANIVTAAWHVAVTVAHGIGNFFNKLSS
ncbi:MAG: hypothetical protein JWR06_287 [Jatrophihabitans sp.]|jgi:hypothetical protein|nr:hypothetical protein [Jatrophihabitans sp.]MCW2656094.1 hypothetical protein [Jatrophihabitans sp.]MDT4899979.1 hypothetical protein [Pseudonocardiales bacterium]MDT4906137.1 hypothetical protein [Pseudonocardiales bacterium]MDT4930171.1 hypothetical protein [Pseudonocardiales bacterium]